MFPRRLRHKLYGYMGTMTLRGAGFPDVGLSNDYLDFLVAQITKMGGHV